MLTAAPVNQQPTIVRPAEFARILGISRQAVSKSIRDQRISGPALTDDGSIWVEEAQRQLGRAPAAAPQSPALPADADEPLYAASRARREAANAALAELQLGEAQGRLVDAAAAERAYEHRMRTLRDRLLMVPSEVAADCERLPDEAAIEARIRQALEAALKDSASAAAHDADHDGDDSESHD